MFTLLSGAYPRPPPPALDPDQAQVISNVPSEVGRHVTREVSGCCVTLQGVALNKK